MLQENRIPFKTKIKIQGREIDFLVEDIAIDIDCHDQNIQKNNMLVENGYTPIHFSNKEIAFASQKVVIEIIKKYYNVNTIKS